MPVLNKKTGQWVLTPKEVSKQTLKKNLKDQLKGKSSLSQQEREALLMQIARDLGYIE